MKLIEKLFNQHKQTLSPEVKNWVNCQDENKLYYYFTGLVRTYIEIYCNKNNITVPEKSQYLKFLIDNFNLNTDFRKGLLSEIMAQETRKIQELYRVKG